MVLVVCWYYVLMNKKLDWGEVLYVLGMVKWLGYRYVVWNEVDNFLFLLGGGKLFVLGMI